MHTKDVGLTLIMWECSKDWEKKKAGASQVTQWATPVKSLSGQQFVRFSTSTKSAGIACAMLVKGKVSTATHMLLGR